MRRFILVIVTAPMLAAVPVAAAEPAPPPRSAFKLDRLDPADILAEERFGGLPKDVVAVLGSSRGRHDGFVYQAAVSPDGKLVASGGTDNLVRLWDARTLRPVAVLKGHTGPPHRLAFSTDGKWLASACDRGPESTSDFTVRVWAIDGAKSRLAAAGKPHASLVHGFRFVQEGRELLTMSSYGEVRSWDLTANPPTEKVLFRVDLGEPTPKRWLVNAAEFTPDGRTLFVMASGDVRNRTQSRAELWDVATGKRRSPPLGLWPDNQLYPHRLLPDGKTLAFGLAARGEGKQVPLKYVPDATMSAGGEVDAPRRVVLWDLGAREPKQVGTLPWEQVDPVLAVAERRYVTTLQIAGPSETVRIWTLKDDRLVPSGRLDLPRGDELTFRGSIGPNCLSADGSVLAAFVGSRVRVWDLTDDGPVERVPDAEPTWAATAIAFGSDGQSVVAAGERTVLWDLVGGSPRARAVRLDGEPFNWMQPRPRYVFSQDGRRMAKAMADWTDTAPFRVWDSATGRTVHTLPRLAAGDPANAWSSIMSAGLNNDGTVLVQVVLTSRGGDTPPVSTVRVWDLRGETPRLTARLAAGNEMFLAVALSPDGRQVVAETFKPAPDDASRIVETAVTVWDVGRAEPAVVARFPNTAGVAALTFSPDGKRLAAGPAGEGRVRVWDLAPKPRERWQVEAKGGIGTLRFTLGGRLAGLGGKGLVGGWETPGRAAKGLYLWDADGKEVASWPDLEARAFSVAPDGRHVVTANANGTVFILRLSPK